MSDARPDPNDKITILGAAGLVGHHLVATLLEQGFQDLVAIDKNEAGLQSLLAHYPGVSVMHADISENGKWEEPLEESQYVVTLQAQIGGVDADAFYRNNIASMERILAVLSSHGTQHLVHVSSSVVSAHADDHYTHTKRSQEELVAQSSVPHTIFRPTLMFGRHDDKHLGWLANFIKKSPVFPLPGRGRVVRQPLYAPDFARVLARALERGPDGRVYPITGLERVHYVDIIRQVRRLLGSRTPMIPIPVPVFAGLLRVWAVFDSDPPFTAAQLDALVAHDQFEMIDWPAIFDVPQTPFGDALAATFADEWAPHP